MPASDAEPGFSHRYCGRVTSFRAAAAKLALIARSSFPMGVAMTDPTLSRVTREGHPRFRERPRLKLPRATRDAEVPQNFVQRSKLRDPEKSSLSAIVRSDLPRAEFKSKTKSKPAQNLL